MSTQSNPICRLPRRIFGNDFTEADAAQQLGFRFGKPIDDLFRQAVLPACWYLKDDVGNRKMRGIFDGENRRRGCIFHSPHSPRLADWYLYRRYIVCRRQDSHEGRLATVTVLDNATRATVYLAGETDPAPSKHAPRDEWRKYYAHLHILGDLAENWLAAQYPEHANVFAYWY